MRPEPRGDECGDDRGVPSPGDRAVSAKDSGRVVSPEVAVPSEIAFPSDGIVPSDAGVPPEVDAPQLGGDPRGRRDSTVVTPGGADQLEGLFVQPQVEEALDDSDGGALRAGPGSVRRELPGVRSIESIDQQRGGCAHVLEGPARGRQKGAPPHRGRSRGAHGVACTAGATDLAPQTPMRRQDS